VKISYLYIFFYRKYVVYRQIKWKWGRGFFVMWNCLYLPLFCPLKTILMLSTCSFKGVKHVGLPFGRNKLLSVVVGKSQTSHHGGIVN
jgi:hypothetical protein